MGMSNTFRELLATDGLVSVPGCFDCVGARAIAKHGFAALYMSGAGVAGTLGYPDYGLVSMSEVVDVAGRIANSVDIPLLADADTGFGNELNVIRTVREFESRGVAAIHIEDQEFPKRCGHLDGKRVIPTDDFARKIGAAADARRSRDFVIIARTDARAVTGFEDAVDRANAALEAGADAIFLEAPQTLDEVKSIPNRVKGPCLLNIAGRKSKTPETSLEEASSFGYKIAILPGILLRSYLDANDEALEFLRTTGLHPKINRDLSPVEIFERLGSQEWDERRSKYA
jgi:2-methylisocitrate lyase-like PEP mutase family enzyme